MERNNDKNQYNQEKKKTKKALKYLESIAKPEESKGECPQYSQYRDCTDPEEVAVFYDDAVYISDPNKLALLDKQRGDGVPIKIQVNKCPFDPTIETLDISIRGCGAVEDKIFALDIYIMRNVRRGNTILVLKDKQDHVVYREISRKGLPKFFDLSIEFVAPNTRYKDKEINAVDSAKKNYQLAGPLKAMLQGHKIEIVKTVKANGENTQISYSQKVNAWVITSKNKAILAREKQDMYLYNTSSCCFAVEMGEVWFDFLECLRLKNGEESVQELKNELSDMTLVGEYIGSQKHQHMVKYNRKTLVFYAVVDKNSSDICWTHERSLALFHKFGLDSVKIESLGLFDRYDSLCDKLYETFRNIAKSKIAEEEEGSVLYLTKRHKSGDASKDKVLSLAKLKTLEYRIFRKMREKLRNYYRNKKQTKSPNSIIKAFSTEMNNMLEGNTLPKPFDFYEGLISTAFEFVNQSPANLDLLNQEYITFQEKLIEFYSQKNELDNENEYIFASKMLDQQEEIKYERPYMYHVIPQTNNENLYRLKVLLIRDQDIDIEVMQQLQDQFNYQETNASNLKSIFEHIQIQSKPWLIDLKDQQFLKEQDETTCEVIQNNSKILQVIIYTKDSNQQIKEALDKFIDQDDIIMLNKENNQKLLNQLLYLKHSSSTITQDKFEEKKKQTPLNNIFAVPQNHETSTFVIEDFKIDETPQFNDFIDVYPSQDQYQTAQSTIFQSLEEYLEAFKRNNNDKTQQKLVIVLIPFGLIGSGKTTFYKKLKEICTSKLGWACETVSSDEIRNNYMLNLMAQNQKVTKDKAFEKSGKQAISVYDKELKRLMKESTNCEEPVKVIFLDKNYPKNGLAYVNKIIESNKPKDATCLKYHLVPQPTKEKFLSFPFSISQIMQCYYRLIQRTEHYTLDNSDPQKASELLFSFLKNYEGQKLNQTILNNYKLDGYFYAPLFAPQDAILIPKEIEDALKNVFRAYKGKSNTPSKLIREFRMVADNYIGLFDGKDPNEDQQEFQILDCKCLRLRYLELLRIYNHEDTMVNSQKYLLEEEEKQPFCDFGDQEEKKSVYEGMMTRLMAKKIQDASIPLYIGVDCQSDKKFKPQRENLFAEFFQILKDHRPDDDFKSLKNAYNRLKNGKGLMGWKMAHNFHVTQEYLGKDPEIAEKSDIYKKFMEGTKVQIDIKAILMIKDKILTGICFPLIEIENEFPHMTMMFRQCEPKNSNDALKETCSKEGAFYSYYQSLKNPDAQSKQSEESVMYCERVNFLGDVLPAYFVKLGQPISFVGLTKKWM